MDSVSFAARAYGAQIATAAYVADVFNEIVAAN